MNDSRTHRRHALHTVLLAFLAALAPDAGALPAAAYIQKGLVACWDGAENAGTGRHNAAATVWRDLVAGREFTLSNVAVRADAMVFAGSATSFGLLSATDTAATFGLAANGTLEIVYAADTEIRNQLLLQSSTASGIAFGIQNATLLTVGNASARRYNFTSGTATNRVAVRYASAMPVSAVANGAAPTTTHSDFWSSANTETTIGTRASRASTHFPGAIYCIRVYDRPLSDAEIALNQAVDETRFLLGKTAPGGIAVVGDPYPLGEPSPAYGDHPGLRPGEPCAFTCPPAATNHVLALSAVCAGYRLRLADGTETSGPATGTNLVYSAELEGAVLTWLWNTTPRHRLAIVNYDEDLATVHVNGEAVADGGETTFDSGESVTLELRDFRNDWYFAYAPPAQTDRALALARWEGLPAGVAADQNPCTFTIGSDLVVTPDVDCKGHVWHAVGSSAISNTVYKMAAGSFNAAKRTVTASTCQAYYAGGKVMDFAMRVSVGGTNYTVASLGTRKMFMNSGVTAIRVAPRLNAAALALSEGVGSQLTSFVGLADCAMTAVPSYMLYYNMSISGPISNHVPRVATSIGDQAYEGRPLTGVLPLPSVRAIGGGAFRSCSGITELYSTSPALTSIGGAAFSGTANMKKITLASPVLSSVTTTSFGIAPTNLTYLSAPPASHSPVDNIFEKVAASDGAKSLHVHLPLCTPGWWEWVSEPTAAEAAAGLPEGCYGVYATGTGARKGWIIATDDVDASLVVTDMSLSGNKGYEIHAGLSPGDTLTLSRPGFTACDLQHFNRATGAWETFATKTATSFTYMHDGRLTRARWKADGYALHLSSDCYGGTFSVSGAAPIAGGNVYAPGAVLTVTALGHAEHPTSHFTAWTSGVTGEATNGTSITVTMDSDKTFTAAFYPDEWLYDAATGTITDGEWTSSAAATLGTTAKSVASPGFSGGRNFSLWLDLALPVHVPSDPESEYAVTSLGPGNKAYYRLIRVGPRFASFASESFRANTRLERIDGIGASSVTVLPYCFLHDCDSAPIHSRTYEANDFLPEALVSVGNYWYTGGPYLVGTLRLPNFKTLPTHGGNNFAARTAGVTNLYLTCEALSSLYVDTTGDFSHFHGMKLQELTIGSTNLVKAKSGSFSGAAPTLERMNFLAHAPAREALDNILASYSARTTTTAAPLQIHCSKNAPGWRDLRSPTWLPEERAARPEGGWSVYETATGKRFFLVQRDSPYDKHPYTLFILR